MSRLSDLLDAYQVELGLTWRRDLSGGERVWMLVYPPDLERSVRAKLPDFALRTTEAKRGWREIDVTDRLGAWIAQHRYAESFFEDPSDLTPSILDGFERELVAGIRDELSALSPDDVAVLIGISSLFPFLRASSLIKAIDDAVPGRLLVLFPGAHDPDTHSFRLLDARDGFNYRARVIEPQKDLA